MTQVIVNSGLLSETRLHVDDTGGTGRPVVLVHGWPMSGESWQEQVRPLAGMGHRVVRYDRRGFGRSARPGTGYDYDTLADDLDGVLSGLDLRGVTLVGFSMGGGEVVRRLARHGDDRVHSIVLAAAVTPYMARTDDNPDGPLDQATADAMAAALTDDRDAFFEGFTTQFFSAGGEDSVTERQRADAIALCRQSDQKAALACAEAFATTDFRGDLATITVPTLVIHGDSDAIVPFEGSGMLTHATIPGAELAVVPGAPHGLNVSHAEVFNRALIAFLAR